MAVRLELHDASAARDAPLVYEFDQARVTIGRASSSDVQLPDPSVSTTHCTLRTHGAGYAAVDEGSSNGTRVNGALIPSGRPKPLRGGDVLQVGTYSLTVAVGVAISAQTPPEQTAAIARKLALGVLVGRGAPCPPPSLTVLAGDAVGARVELGPEELIIGRGEECGLRLTDADLSREHAVLRLESGTYVLEDLGSKNGLRVNGRPVDRPRRLRDRDEIELGRTSLLFEDPAAAALRHLEQEEVQAAPPPPPPPEPVPPAWEGDVPAVAPVELPPEPAPAAPGAKVDRRRRASDGRYADMMIYMLAGAVLALSAVGLYLLLRSG